MKGMKFHCSVIKNAKCPNSQNLSGYEEKALKDLQNEKDIVVTMSDKGNAVVVMNSAYYHKQIQQILQDKKVYKRITDKRRNPTSKIGTELQEHLLILKTKGNLTERECKKLRPSDSYLAAFYGLPKIHQVSLSEQYYHFKVDPNTETPMRPIISSMNSPTYEISKHLAQILKYLYNDYHTVKNSKEFGRNLSLARL